MAMSRGLGSPDGLVSAASRCRGGGSLHHRSAGCRIRLPGEILRRDASCRGCFHCVLPPLFPVPYFPSLHSSLMYSIIFVSSRVVVSSIAVSSHCHLLLSFRPYGLSFFDVLAGRPCLTTCHL
jgi:hypothetical protein